MKTTSFSCLPHNESSSLNAQFFVHLVSFDLTRIHVGFCRMNITIIEYLDAISAVAGL